MRDPVSRGLKQGAIEQSTCPSSPGSCFYIYGHERVTASHPECMLSRYSEVRLVGEQGECCKQKCMLDSKDRNCKDVVLPTGDQEER